MELGLGVSCMHMLSWISLWYGIVLPDAQDPMLYCTLFRICSHVCNFGV